jgi:hypothetical protein
VHGGSGGDGQDDNPFDFDKVCDNIAAELFVHGYIIGEDFEVMLVPNIVDISYGRGVGYSFTEHDLGATIHNISATRIRNDMREKGEIE